MEDIKSGTSRNSAPTGSRETENGDQSDPDIRSKLDKDQVENDVMECSVCLQPCIHPVQLPCQHIFCFLCVKGAAHRSKKCALCRQEIVPEFFQKPKLVRQEDLEKTLTFDDKYQWFYEGRNGWWQYDDRTSQELEGKHKNGDKLFELLIAGFLYVIDLENMVQFRRNDRTRKRNIKRDVITIEGIKGVAGLKYAHQSTSERPGAEGLEQQQQPRSQPGIINIVPPTDTAHDDAMLSPPAPNNTPQTPQTPADSPPNSTAGSQQDLSLQFQHLTIVNENDQPRAYVSVPDSDQSNQRTQPTLGGPTHVIEQQPVRGRGIDSLSSPLDFHLDNDLFSSDETDSSDDETS